MIDAHVHILPPYRSAKAVRWLKKYIPWLNVSDTIDEVEILQTIKSLGIDYFFNYVYPLTPEESRPLNTYNYQLSKRVENAICFGSVHALNQDLSEIIEEAILTYDLLGLKFHPFVQGFDILDPRMDEVYQVMTKLGRPIVFHTGFDRFYGAKMGFEKMEKILTRYPNLTVVIAHMFYPHIEDAFYLLRAYENVYLDGSNVFSDYQESLDGENLFDATLVERGSEQKYHIYFHYPLEELEQFSHRIMFGSDYPVAMNDLEKIYACVQKMDISAAAKQNITENTAKNFIKKFKADFFVKRAFNHDT